MSNDLSTAPAPGEREQTASLMRQLAAVRTKTVRELVVMFHELFGTPTRSNNPDYLRNQITYRIQQLAEGIELSAVDRERIAELAPLRLTAAPPLVPPAAAAPPPRALAAPIASPLPSAPQLPRSRRTLQKQKQRDPRVPPVGTVITRTHAGVEHTVLVRADGFEHAGTHYRSLSQIAKVITGTEWNGYVFFFGNGATAAATEVAK